MGKRLVQSVPHGHWQTTTFLAALRANGLSAPWVVDGAINGEIFRAYVEQHLAPTLKPGDWVIMDNLSSHKVSGVREALESVGAQAVYLPPYSPDYNPIEMLFSKLKALMRKYGERTREGLWHRVGELAESITSGECSNYLNHCGYTLHLF
jgi:transposase